MPIEMATVGGRLFAMGNFPSINKGAGNFLYRNQRGAFFEA